MTADIMKKLSFYLYIFVLIALVLCGCKDSAPASLEGTSWVAYSDVTVQTVEFSADGTLTIGNRLLQGIDPSSLGLTEEELKEAFSPRVFYYKDKVYGKCFSMYSTPEDMSSGENGIDVEYSFTEDGIKISGAVYKRQT